MTTPPEVPDGEIRDWAKSTGRKVTERGRVPDVLRAEYMTELAALQGGAETDAGPPPAERPPARGPESVSKPSAARAETRPRKVKPAAPSGILGRAKAWLNGATTTTTPAGRKTTPKAAPDRPRTPITKLVETLWDEAAGVMEHVNIPVARTMAWQAPYVGIVTDDVLKGSPVDRILQPIARAQTTLQGLGAMFAMPVVVGLMTAEANDPERHGLAAVARQQVYERVLVASIDAQLEMFGSSELAARIKRSSEDREKRQAEVDQITGMIFSDLPAAVQLGEDATPQEVAEAQAAAQEIAERERQLRAAAAAVSFMAATVPAGPDLRGQAGIAAAAAIANAGNAAAAAEAQALAGAQ